MTPESPNSYSCCSLLSAVLTRFLYSLGTFAPIHVCKVKFTLKKKTNLKSFQISSVTILLSKDFQHKSKNLAFIKKRTTTAGQAESDLLT